MACEIDPGPASISIAQSLTFVPSFSSFSFLSNQFDFSPHFLDLCETRPTLLRLLSGFIILVICAAVPAVAVVWLCMIAIDLCCCFD